MTIVFYQMEEKTQLISPFSCSRTFRTHQRVLLVELFSCWMTILKAVVILNKIMKNPFFLWWQDRRVIKISKTTILLLRNPWLPAQLFFQISIHCINMICVLTSFSSRCVINVLCASALSLFSFLTAVFSAIIYPNFGV